MDWPAIYAFLQTGFGTTIVALILTWFLGSSISTYWTSRQKRKEADLAAAKELYDLYGEFVAIWKLWNSLLAESNKATSAGHRVDLLGRSAAMEGRFESLLLRLTSQYSWSSAALLDLGLLRQTFQLPRSCIKENEPLPWTYSEHPQYLALKNKSSAIGTMLGKRMRGVRSSISQAQDNFIHVTANAPHEAAFKRLGRLDP